MTAPTMSAKLPLGASDGSMRCTAELTVNPWSPKVSVTLVMSKITVVLVASNDEAIFTLPPFSETNT
jgi:hypothetical protein